jgi:hypothetical protein
VAVPVVEGRAQAQVAGEKEARERATVPVVEGRAQAQVAGEEEARERARGCAAQRRGRVGRQAARHRPQQRLHDARVPAMPLGYVSTVNTTRLLQYSRISKKSILERHAAGNTYYKR